MNLGKACHEDHGGGRGRKQGQDLRSSGKSTIVLPVIRVKGPGFPMVGSELVTL